MTPDPISQRIARARFLADRHPPAAEVLTFYAKLVEYQHALLDRLPEIAFDREDLARAVPAFLDWLEREGPPALSASAADRRRIARDDWRDRFDQAIAPTRVEADGLDSCTMFVVDALLQPFEERRAQADRETDLTAKEYARSTGRCPACGDLPVVGVLREEGHGARRSLVCGRCATEWAYTRLACPGCGERQFESLPVYTAEQFGHIRVEACDRCRRFLKTVDLTKDGLAEPFVDDLASISLDLWARSQGYERLRPNLLRV
jgi:FdhE protein